MKKNKLKSAFTILVAMLFVKASLATIYPKVSTIDFGYSSSSQTSNLYVRSNSPSLACVLGAQAVLKKATLNGILDWKGDYTDASAAGYTVVLTITGYNYYPGSTATPAVVAYSKTLTINKNQPQSYFSFDITGVYTTVNRFEVTAVYTRSGSSEPAVEAVMKTTVYYTEDFEYNVSVLGTPTINTNPVVYQGTEAKFTWAAMCVPAPDYEFQLLRLYNSSGATSSSETTITAGVDWSKAMSVETGNSLQELKLTITEGTGYYVWRVRPIGNAFEGGFGNARNWGDWSDVGAYTDGYAGVISAVHSPYLFYYNQFDNDRNWIFSRSFIEGDAVNNGQVNIGEAISYANGLQMVQQQQTRLKTAQKIVAGETIYDYSGRPALTTMAAPLNAPSPSSSTNTPYTPDVSTLGYINSYIKNQSSNVYSAADFDANTNYLNPPKIDTTTDGTGKYYSYGNTLESNVATASGYPYSRTLYMRDGTSKPKEQSGPGLYHKLGNAPADKHTTRNYNSSVTDGELIRVLGDEAPAAESVLKTITTDANNEISIAYVSKEGNTIATCLSNPKGTNLDALDPLPTAFTLDYHVNNNTPYGANGLSAFKTIVLTASTVVNISYEITPKIYSDACIDFCATCDYKVTIRIINNDDPDGSHPADQVFTFNPTSGTYSSCTTSTITPSSLVTSVTLDAGSYTIERIIEANQVDPASATAYPATAPASPGTPFIDQYLKHIEKGMRDLYASTTAINVTIYNLAGGVLSTHSSSMSAILSYLQSPVADPAFVPNLSGLYTSLGIAQTSDAATNPDHFDLELACDNIITLPVEWCNQNACPSMVPNPANTSQSVYDFEKLYIDWFHSQPGHSTTSVSIHDLFPRYVAGEFNVVVTNMITCGGYDCRRLLENFRSIYFMSQSTTLAALPGAAAGSPSVPGAPAPGFSPSTPLDLFDVFMSSAEYGTTTGGGVFTRTGVGYQIAGINNAVGGLGCGTGDMGYKFHPYKYIKYDETNRCISCEIAYYGEVNGTAATATAFPTTSSYTATYTSASVFQTYFNSLSPLYVSLTSTTTPAVTNNYYPHNDFYNCAKICSTATIPSGSSGTFTTGAIASCDQACEDRYPLFVSDLIATYHQSGLQVTTDPYNLVASGTSYVYGGTAHTPGSSDVQLSTIYCQVQNLVDACKTHCNLTVQADGSLGSTAEHDDMANAMYGTFELKLHAAGEACTSPYTSYSSTPSSFDVPAYEHMLNYQLAIEKTNAPAGGFYWNYSDFLTGTYGLDASISGACTGTGYVFVHPDIPSYFAFDSGLGELVYIFNKEQAGVSLASKHIYSKTSAAVIAAGTGGMGFTYTSATTGTGAAALTLDLTSSASSFVIDNSFSPFINGSAPAIAFSSLISAGVSSATGLYNYNSTQNGWWKFELCPHIKATATDCDPVCYHIRPLAAINPADPAIADELITYTAISCDQETATEFLNIINDRVNTFVTHKLQDMRLSYHTQCVDLISDDLEISFDVYYHHYTLYYYDRAGNLVKTVPPAGVSYYDASAVLLTSRTQHPNHTLVTAYAYNSLKELVHQETPDGGKSNFWYDNKARLRLSQNEKQLNHTIVVGGAPSADAKLSYTKYDELGRIIQVGETSYAGTPTDALINTSTFPSTGNDITVTTYSSPAGVTYFGNQPQRFLQNRVSYSFSDKDGNSSTTNDQVLTYYSYDPHGNVEWMIQEVPEIGRSYIGYEYDLISGSVLKVKYNEELADKFFHRYTYDVDKRIQTAETSRDGILWVKDATYSYYMHGPLKRTVLGKDKVQGQDYVYTLEGWLKGLNHPNSAYDPGKDSDPAGNADVAKDEYSMMLNYYHGDYMNNSSKFNADESSNAYFLHQSGRDLYNGNISSWTNGYNNEAITRVSAGAALQNMDVITGRTFHYDELNRITDAEFNTYDATAGSWTASLDYRELFSYDGNGNILQLKRRGYSASTVTATATDERKMDFMNYQYYSGKNQLAYVSDIADNPSATRYTDIKNQTDVQNYKYDEIGNLISDTQEGISGIEWNVYGKIAKISKTDGTRLEFLYDATGKRVYKKVYNTSDVVLTAKTSYYSLDASGNSMAIYSRENTGSSPSYTATFKLKEEAVYGSDRLGMRTDDITLRTAAFTGSTAPVTGAGTVYHATAFNKTMAPANALVSVILPAYPTPLVFISSKGAANTLETGITPATATAAVTPLYGIAGSNSAEYEDDCGYVVLKSMVMAQYNGVTNVSLVTGRNGNLFNTVGLKDYSKGKSMFMRKPGSSDEYYYFTVGTDKKAYYHIFNAVTGATISMNNPLDTRTYEYAMALLEDRVGPGSSQLYMKRQAGSGQMQLVRFEITASGIGPVQVVSTYGSAETAGSNSEMQINPAGDKLLVGNNQGTATLFGMYTTGGALVQYDLSATHIPSAASTALYSFGNNSVCQSFDYTATGDYVIFQNMNTMSQPLVKRITSALVAGSSTFTFSPLSNGDIRKGKNGNVYISNIFTNKFFELKNVNTLTWTSATSSNIAIVSSAAGQQLSGGLSLNRHLIHNGAGCASDVFARVLGHELYELKDHLGNVHAVITDRKVSILVSGAHDHYIADVSSVDDYYAFGMEMPGRSFSANNYRYGFNGKEKDDEISGTGDEIDFGARTYDSRLGRWWSIDNKAAKYPGFSPYVFAANDPISYADIDGNDIIQYHITNLDETGSKCVYTTGQVSATTEAVLKNMMKTPEGMGFLMQFAKKGQTLAGYTFTEDGALSNHDLSIYDYSFENLTGNNPSGLAGEFGASYNPAKNNLNFTLSLDSQNQSEGSLAETYTHETKLHGDQVKIYADAFKKGGKAGFEKTKAEENKRNYLGQKDHLDFATKNTKSNAYNSFIRQKTQLLKVAPQYKTDFEREEKSDYKKY